MKTTVERWTFGTHVQIDVPISPSPRAPLAYVSVNQPLPLGPQTLNLGAVEHLAKSFSEMAELLKRMGDDKP